MPKHRSLSLKTFVHGIPWDLFLRYFETVLPGRFQPHFSSLAPDQDLTMWSFLNPDALEQFLDDPRNAEASKLILEQFSQINDIAAHGPNLLVQAYHQAGARFDEEKTVQELAMLLFLDHPDAFRYAWSRYLFYSSDAKMASYPLEVTELNVGEAQVQGLQVDVSRYFATQAMGGRCHVHCYQEEEQTTVYVQRGNRMRTVAHWKNEGLEMMAFRPAAEDLLVYDPQQSALSIKTAQRKNRDFYLGLFAHHLAGDGGLARTAVDTPMFTLAPIQEGSFDYTGNGAITGIALTWVKLQFDDPECSVFDIKSQNVLETMRKRFPGVSLRQGNLVSARLAFRIYPDEGRPDTITFEIEPPARTNLTQKRYADIIEDYLREQGVMLR
ncbi:MAG: hypothetical protein ACE5Q6_17335 [Dehalococcoidia bacterium]